jgi:putative flippase GtrA
MSLFLKTQAALIIGSLADFSVTILLVQTFHCWYVAGNTAGNICGAAAQFLLSRKWVFANSQLQPVPAQMGKFILMWAGNIVLSALFVFLLTNYLHIYYLASKVIVSVLLGVTYTYFVSKKFVFTS